MPDVREVLERSAAEPAGGPDTASILRRARSLDRRRKAAWVAAPALVLLAALVAGPSLLPAPSVILGPGGDRDAFTLPPPGEVSAEVLGDGTPVFVVRGEDGAVGVVEAIDAQRPWGMGQLVGWCPSSQWFEEPRHGSRFTPEGLWVAGPAPEGLATYAARVEGGHVVVGERRPGEPRRPLDAAPAGPTCEALEDLVLNRFDGPAAWPEEAAAAGTSGWVLVAGTVIHTEGDMPRICRGPRGDPPRCPDDAPVAHGVEPRLEDLRWWSATGTFLARFAPDGDGVAGLVMTPDVEIEQGYKVSEERWFGFIHRIAQRDDGSWWVEFEQAEWLEEVPEDEEFIRRQPDPEVVGIDVHPDAEVYGSIRLNRRGLGLVPMTLEDLLAADDLDTIPFRVTVDRDSRTVVRIEERYTP